MTSLIGWRLGGEESTEQDEGRNMSDHRRPGLSDSDRFDRTVTKVLGIAIAIATVTGLIRCAALLLQNNLLAD